MLRFSLSLATALTVASHVGAVPLTLQETFGTFNAVTQSFTGNSEAEGRVFIQGNSNGTVTVNDRVRGDNGDGFDDLIISGDVTGGRVTVGNSGNLTVGGNVTNTSLQLNGGVQTATLGGVRTGGNFNQNEDILIQNATNLRIPNVSFDAFAAESAFLRGLDSVAVNTSDRNNIVFGGAPVVSTSIAALGSGTARFNLTGLDTLIVNVSGTSGRIGVNFVDNNGIRPINAATAVIFNFFEAETLTLGSTLFGHVIAPSATVTLGSSNEGTIISRALVANNGELHPLSFTGTVPTPVIPEEITPPAVPLPASLPLLIGALGVIGAMRSRKKTA